MCARLKFHSRSQLGENRDGLALRALPPWIDADILTGRNSKVDGKKLKERARGYYPVLSICALLLPFNIV